MGKLYALVRREMGSLFVTPSLYLVTAFFVLLYSLAFYLIPVQTGTASFESVAMFIGFMSVFLVPLITMRSFAEERATGTIELLLTAPVKPCEVVLSKLIGAYVFFLATLVPCIVYIALLAYCGDVDRGAAISAFLGLILLGGLYVSVGVFASSLTDSQIVAAATTGGALLILLLLSSLDENSTGVVGALRYASYWPHFKENLAQGLIDAGVLVYFLSFIATMAFCTWLVLSSRDMSGRAGGDAERKWQLFAGVALAAALAMAQFGVARIDINGASLDDITANWKEQGFGSFLNSAYPFALALALAAGALFCLRLSRRSSFGEIFTSMRRGAVAANLIGIVAIVLIAGNINFLSTLAVRMWNLEWDMTEAQEKTLSPDTRMMLDSLEDRLQITVFYSKDVDYKGVALVDNVKDLLLRYVKYNSNIHVDYADAVREPEKALKLAKEMNLKLEHLAQLAMINYKGRKLVMPAGMLLEAPDSMAQMAGMKNYSFRGELGFSTAIKRLQDPRQTRVYFTSGHGEMSIASMRSAQNSAGKFATSLKREALEVKNLPLVEGRAIPRDCDVLIIAGARLPFGENITIQIAAYLARGGNILFLAAPSMQEAKGGLPSMDKLLMACGGKPRNDIAFDNRNNENGVASNIYSIPETSNGIVSAKAGVYCVMPMSCSIRENPKAEEHGWITSRLLVTSDGAWSQEKKDGKWDRRPGPLALACSSIRPGEKGAPDSRVVVIGSSEFVSNITLEKAHNRMFAVSVVRWLAGRQYNLDIKPREYVDRSFRLDGYKRKFIWWISIMALPQVWLLMGALVWWMRRR